jgi:hypothetical protein
MSIPPAWPQRLDFFGAPLVLEPSPGQLSSDAGLVPIGQFDQRIGLTRAFAEALDDPRDPDLTEHTFLEMVRARVYGILAGYADQNDHDTLRAELVFKRIADCWGVGGLPVEEYRRQAGARLHGETVRPCLFHPSRSNGGGTSPLSWVRRFHRRMGRRAKSSDTVRHNQRANSVDSCIRIGSVGCVELVAIANPGRFTPVLQLLHEFEIVIARHTKDVPNTSFLQAAKQKVPDRLVHNACLLSMTW